ncbi:uncharacterized protein UTRI_01313 [Ustilago trichophora]|uniref:Zn(2)-C6 fungal-type domain-containing protein n=1 Tax=Ustilago trichophora TaxID=86804 RepID=A0A5C3DWC8_9BASI|nr:uncharacterized protein UTRI_01313 [Ustilago trichophora]
MNSPYDSTHPSRPALARKRTSEKAPSEQGIMEADSPSDSQDGKGKTRARINMACIHCRHRKIKCDGAQPACATCVRLRRECEYEPVTEYENLMSRERKRRNKEKKAARMASLGIFAGQSPLSMLHPGATLGLPPNPLAHYGDFSQQNLTPLFLSMPDPRLEGQPVESQFGPRRRRGISDTQAVNMQHRLGTLTSPLPDPSLQHASVSQPPTPAQTYRFYQTLALSPAQHNMVPNVPAEYFYGPLSAPLMPPASAGPFFTHPQPSTPGSIVHQQQQQMMASPHIVDLMGLSSSSSVPALPSGRASATEADFDLGMVDFTGVPTVVPTSAHVRPVDLPAPHGHFDFASVPFPTQDTFASELPISALRRRSSIHLPVGTADAFRRPSVAEVATAALMQKVAVKRTEKVNTDIKQLADDLLSTDATGIVAWNAHVQSQLPASMATWSGFNSTLDVVAHPETTCDYVPLTMPASRSNSDGLLSLGPLSPPTTLISSGLVQAEQGAEGVSATSSCSVSSSTADSSSLPAEVHHSYFDPSAGTGKVSREISPFALSPSGSSHPSSLLTQEAWSSFRTDNVPLLSPVSELNANFGNFSVFNPSPNSQQHKTEDPSSLSMAFTHNINNHNF